LKITKEIKLILALRKLRKGLEEANKERRLGMKNWKTTLFGALAVFVTSIKPLLPQEFHQLADASAQLLVAVGLFFAKDHNQ
jgi:hypothetical protein